MGIDAYPAGRGDDEYHRRVLELQSNHAKTLTMELLCQPDNYAALFRHYSQAIANGASEGTRLEEDMVDGRMMARAVVRTVIQGWTASAGPKVPWCDTVMPIWAISGYRYSELLKKKEQGRIGQEFAFPAPRWVAPPNALPPRGVCH